MRGRSTRLLKANCAIIFNTSNTESAREQAVFGDPLETIWRYCVFGLCGVPVVHRRMFAIVVTSSDEERKKWLSEVAAIIERFFPKGSTGDRGHSGGLRHSPA